MTAKALVAGLGNVFFSDDGFGVEVAVRLTRELPRDDVRVMDIGIRARDLAYELAGGAYDTAILVDAVARGGQPGTLYLIAPDAPSGSPARAPASLDGHSMTPDAVLALLDSLGGSPTEILLLGCEPGCMDEGMGLTPHVSAAVDPAIAWIRDLLDGAAIDRRSR